MAGMAQVEFYVDPACPWAWITSRWVKDVAPQRDLDVIWRSYCLEIRDDYDVAPMVPPENRDMVMEAHAISHRMLRIFEAVRTGTGEDAVDKLYTEWGRRYFTRDAATGDDLLSQCLEASGLDHRLIEAMEVAYAFGGPKTQTPTIVVRADPPYGFKGPVMAPAPTGEAAVRMWDAIQTLAAEPGFFEITRPRVNPPRAPKT
jgi:hypothetical protein